MEEERPTSQKGKTQDSPSLHGNGKKQYSAPRAEGDATFPSATRAYERGRGEGPLTSTLQPAQVPHSLHTCAPPVRPRYAPERCREGKRERGTS